MKKRRLCSSIIITIVMIISSIPCIPMSTSAADNEKAIYDYLTGELGFNTAAACGILANIGEESSFNPTKTEGGNGAGYGLCQWTGSRRSNLTTWCGDNSLDYRTIRGQLLFLKHELYDDYHTLYESFISAPNTSDGANKVAADWCMEFERPEYRDKAHGQYDSSGNSVVNGGYDKFKAYNGRVYKCTSDRIGLTESQYRGYLAASQYWPKYSGNYPIDDELGIPYPRPSGNPLLRKGSKGVYVGWVQYALSEKLGYDIGNAGVDCDFGSATEAAVKAFQSDNGLEVDGIVGPATINGLYDSIYPYGECRLEVASDYITINKNIEQKAAVDCTYYNTRRDVSNFKLQYSCEQKNALHLEWGEWNNRTCTLNISANSIGTVKVTVKLLNSDTDEVLDTKDITVVSTGDTSVSLSSTTITLNLDKNETQDIVATVKCFPRDGKMDYTGKTDAAEIVLMDKIIENNTPKITFRIKPIAAGKEEFRFMIKNNAGQVVAEAKADITVVLDTKTVSFDSNGGKCSTTEKTVKFNSSYGELPVPTREGYIFDGWYTAKDGGTRINASTIMSNTANHTLYAHWTGMAVNITLIDELSGAKEQFTARYGDKFSVSMIKKTLSVNDSDPTADRLLMGWSDKPDGKVIIKSGDVIKPVSGQETGSMTLYARWINPKLTLKVNGQESYEATPGETVNVTLEVEGAANAYGTLQSRFTFSPELQLTDGKTGQAFSVVAAKSDSIVAISGAAGKNCGGNGLLYSCNITIPENAPRGEVYPLELLFDDNFVFQNITDNKITAEMQKYAASHSKGCIIKVKEFSVENTNITLHNGEQYEINANEEAVTYSSSNTKIAVVSKSGVITAVGEGTAKISVITSDSEVIQIDVTVVCAKEAVLYGDVNLDGKVTAADATAIMQYIANRDKYALSEQSIINADVCGNGDGITAMDALMIQQVDSGLITESELLTE